MINLYTWPTPNGRKISILLEELQVPYKIIPIDIEKDKQFSKEFSLISPSNKIPAITDQETKTNIFESGAIMLYLANKYNKFFRFLLKQKDENEVQVTRIIDFIKRKKKITKADIMKWETKWGRGLPWTQYRRALLNHPNIHDSMKEFPTYCWE